MTKQFYEILDERLTDEGIMISNFLGTLQGQDSKLFQSYYNTLQEIFPTVFVFPSDIKDTDKRQNIAIVALKYREPTMLDNIAHMQLNCEIQEIMGCEKFFENYYPSPKIKNDTKILTDQLSPVNILNQPPSEISQVYREIKNDTDNLEEFVVVDSFIQIILISGVVVWGYNLRKVWKKNI